MAIPTTFILRALSGGIGKAINLLTGSFFPFIIENWKEVFIVIVSVAFIWNFMQMRKENEMLATLIDLKDRKISILEANQTNLKISLENQNTAIKKLEELTEEQTKRLADSKKASFAVREQYERIIGDLLTNKDKSVQGCSGNMKWMVDKAMQLKELK